MDTTGESPQRNMPSSAHPEHDTSSIGS